jgi:hypothetical protein
MSGRAGYRLTAQARSARESFERQYGDRGNCSCHVSPPCGSCLHPGNPSNQAENDEAWEPIPSTTDEEREKGIAAYVRCHGGLVDDEPGCGLQPLTQSQYEQQLSNPHKTWRCPSCGNSADYDDTESERVQGVNDELMTETV